MKFVLVNLLQKLRDENVIASIYTNNENSDIFSVGIIKQIDDNNILLASIGTNGEYQGYQTISMPSIYMISYNGKYEHRVKSLYNTEKRLHRDSFHTGPLLIPQLLELAKSSNLIVSVELCKSNSYDVQGFVNKIIDDYVYIDAFDEFGEPNGSVVLNINEVTSVVCDSEDENNIKVLASLRNKGIDKQ